MLRTGWLSVPRRRLALLGLLLLATCTHPTGPAAVSDQELAARLGSDAPLLPLFHALARAEAGQGQAVVLQIGDSHTANDGFSGRIRDLLQSRFGNAGRGMLPPGIPYRYYRPDRVHVTAQGWTVASSYRSADPAPFGLAAVRQHADGAAEMTVSVSDPADLNQAEVELLRQPGGGSVQISMDGGTAYNVSTDGPREQPMWVSAPSASGSGALTVRTHADGPVDVLAWRVGRDTAGVTWSNLGTVGATVGIMDRWDPAVVRQELDHLKPALIVIAFGTNEGFHDDTDVAAYQSYFAARLHALHEAAPDAALLVLGPPDAERRRPGRSGAPSTCGDPHWVYPPRLNAIRQAQRTAAAQEHAFFWDWQAAMGGPCSMAHWTHEQPPLAAADHVHLLTGGYRRTADALFRTLMAGFDHFKTLVPMS
jgi:lysophospholipase L1-like esterase